MRIDTDEFFSWAALPYDFLTSQSVWRDHCREMMEHFPQQEAPWKVLDLGCGPGHAALALAQGGVGMVTGIDVAGGMLRRAQRAASRAGNGADRISLARADAARLPFASDTFDAATGHSFLYLTDDPGEVLVEVQRVLRPGGSVVLLEPADDAPGWDLLPQVLRSGRFAVSVVLWRMMSKVSRRFTRHGLGDLLVDLHFVNVAVERTLGGLGFMAVGRKSGSR